MLSDVSRWRGRRTSATMATWIQTRNSLSSVQRGQWRTAVAATAHLRRQGRWLLHWTRGSKRLDVQRKSSSFVLNYEKRVPYGQLLKQVETCLPWVFSRIPTSVSRRLVIGLLSCTSSCRLTVFVFPYSGRDIAARLYLRDILICMKLTKFHNLSAIYFFMILHICIWFLIIFFLASSLLSSSATDSI